MGAKLFVSYKIENVIEGIVKPGDELKGKVFVRCEESKAQKLKGVMASLAEHYNEDVWEEDFHTKDWALKTKDQSNPLKTYEIFKADTKIEPGDTQEFDFVIKLPSIPGPKKWGWYVSLFFLSKGGMFSSGAKDADDATCVLPVPGSTRMPSFGEIPGGPVIDPPRNPPPRPSGPTPSQAREAREARREDRRDERREERHQESFSNDSFAPSPPSEPSRPSFGGSHGRGVQCLKCHGSGQCKSCNGTGQKGHLECIFCHGSGKCDWCGGAGYK